MFPSATVIPSPLTEKGEKNQTERSQSVFGCTLAHTVLYAQPVITPCVFWEAVNFIWQQLCLELLTLVILGTNNTSGCCVRMCFPSVF